MKFYKLFNIFTKNTTQDNIIDDTKTELAYIKYYVDQDGIKIDVSLEDVGDESIKYLSILLNTLSNEDSFKNTLKIVENFFIESKEHESLLKLYSALDPKIIKQKLNNIENSPYIKPSEMIK